ncbi:acyltransferase [Latilactobacillus curvatus]|uniref:acyltransferase n=1 Tax=Latilactobacillus curvatus TaxID=28038 RepID=UPI0020C7B07B|nr:acyltransferase [Latilactobacillus curvatus]MCP8865979.1 acyltransferase [Latilactobacillus curvatus]MCP8870098.1 acyltransferase [Latilactobacillus curvatus]MCS6143672.1 acyltransferase [Latilactobacillus curvatus]
MGLEGIIRKISGKKDFQLSHEVPITYIIRKGRIYIFGIIRGSFKSIFIKKCGKRLVSGRNVKIILPSKLYLGSNVRLDSNVTLDALSEEGINLGDRVKIGENSSMLCTGSLHCIGKGISIGNDSSFAENTFFGAAGGIKIGNDVISGQNVRFHAENHNFSNKDELIRNQGVNRQGIKIGNNVWIGAGVVFLDGSIVGDGCVIGANTLVNGVFKDNSIIVGTPAKVIGSR